MRDFTVVVSRTYPDFSSHLICQDAEVINYNLERIYIASLTSAKSSITPIYDAVLCRLSSRRYAGDEEDFTWFNIMKIMTSGSVPFI